MKKSRKALFHLMVLMMILSIVIAGCTSQSEDLDDTNQKWDYRPMITKENLVYGDIGKTIQVLPEGIVLLGKTERKVSQTEPMVKGRAYFVSNTLPVETEIYGNERSEEIIYADFNGSFIVYERIDN